MIEEHYSPGKVAKLFGRSEQWVWMRCRDGSFGPVIRDGGGWLIPVSGIQKYLDQNRVHNHAENNSGTIYNRK